MIDRWRTTHGTLSLNVMAVMEALPDKPQDHRSSRARNEGNRWDGRMYKAGLHDNGSFVRAVSNSHPWGEDRCTPAVAVELLGNIRFAQPNRVVIDPPSSSQRRMLAVLALRSRCSTGPDHLADLLGIAPGAVRTVMSRLRQSLGCDVIQTESHGYRLTTAVDVLEVERLAKDHSTSDRLRLVERALSMWRGEALREFRTEPWARAEAVRLDELHAQLSDEYAELLIAAGCHGEAILSLAPRVVDQPLRDRTQGLLMLALAGEGRQIEALRSYQNYRRLLADELGVRPSRWIREIEQQVALDGDTCGMLVA